MLLPPKPSEFGHQPFTSHEQESLARWLSEPAWPRGMLNIHALEGYLTAPLVCRSHCSRAWNEGGKVRPPIDTAQRYGELLELILGFLRTIDRGLPQTTPMFEPSLHLQLGHDRLDVKVGAQSWAQGFGLGLRLGVQARVVPTAGAREAVHTIAT